MTTMHVGTHDFSALYALLPVTENRPCVRIAGTPNGSPDSWEEWGRHVMEYEDGDTHPSHVIIIGSNADVLLADLRRVYQADHSLLSPMHSEGMDGTFVVLTEDDPVIWHQQTKFTEEQFRLRVDRQENCMHLASDPVGTEACGSTIYRCQFCLDVWNEEMK